MDTPNRDSQSPGTMSIDESQANAAIDIGLDLSSSEEDDKPSSSSQVTTSRPKTTQLKRLKTRKTRSLERKSKSRSVSLEKPGRSPALTVTAVTSTTNDGIPDLRAIIAEELAKMKATSASEHPLHTSAAPAPPKQTKGRMSDLIAAYIRNAMSDVDPEQMSEKFIHRNGIMLVKKSVTDHFLASLGWVNCVGKVVQSGGDLCRIKIIIAYGNNMPSQAIADFLRGKVILTNLRSTSKPHSSSVANNVSEDYVHGEVRLVRSSGVASAYLIYCREQ